MLQENIFLIIIKIPWEFLQTTFHVFSKDFTKFRINVYDVLEFQKRHFRGYMLWSRGVSKTLQDLSRSSLWH